MLLGGKNKMANEQNLKPLNKRTKSEQREIAKKGRKIKWKIKKKEKIYKRKPRRINDNGFKRYKTKKQNA